MNIRLLQWNVWFRENANNIIKVLQEVDADILCLQELTQDSATNPGRNILLEINKLGYNHEFVLALERTGENYYHMGNGIFSKFPITTKSHVFVQRGEPGTPTYDQENRAYVEITVETPAGTLTIGTVHLSHTHLFVSNDAKEKETRLLVNTIRHHPSRFILAGDFNDLPDSETVKVIEGSLQHAGPDYSVATWTTKPYSFPGFEAKHLGWRLDYVFTTPDVRVRSSRTIHTDVSDHLPILVEIVL